MPIKVRCPNPQCGRVHQVKDRWAGKRGTCPSCGCVIVVPAVVERDTVPLEPVPQEPEMEPTAEDEALENEAPEGDEEEYEERPRRRRVMRNREEDEEDYEEEERPRRRGAVRNHRDHDEEEEEERPRRHGDWRDRAEEHEEDDEEYEDEQPQRKKPTAAAGPGWWLRPTTILTLLGVIAFAFVAFVPVLPGPTVKVIPGPNKGVPDFPGDTVDPDIVTTLLILIILGCGLAVAGLVISRRHSDWHALLPIYGALVLTALVVVKLIFQRPYGQEQIDKYTPKVTTFGGQVTGTPGSGVTIAIVVGVIAMLAFAAAVIVGHREKWARMVSAAAIFVVAVVGSLVVFLVDWS